MFFLSRFEKVKLDNDNYIYIHIIWAKKLVSLIIYSGDIESLLITSPNISSTLKLVFFMISFLLSR